MKEIIIILGAGVMQGPALKTARELGFYTIALDGSSSAPCVSLADRFEKIDLKDKEGIEVFANSVQKTAKRLGIMTAGTDFSASVAWTAEKLGLPGIPYEAALNASDKSRMRECFKKASLPSPEFFTITKQDNIKNIPIPFPLVIKPVDNMGSRGCRRVNDIEEFHEAAENAINYSRSGKAIAEVFMDGPEFSVDAIVYHGEITICGLADRHIFFPPYFIEMGHTMPTVFDMEKQSAILETFCAAVHSLGLCGKDYIGAAKGDIKLTSKGPMIGEVAARLSGGYMSGWTYPYSSGVNPVKAAILMAMGRKPEGLVPDKKWTCAERAFISIPGTVRQITGTENTGNQPFVNDLFLRIKEGTKVTFPENNVTKCGNIIASAPDRETAIKAAETAACSVLIRLDPSDLETKKFLQDFSRRGAGEQRHREDPQFPPDAYIITEDILEALSQLPDNHNINVGNNNISNINFANQRLCENSPLQISLIPFPELTTSTLTDYMGRTVNEALDAVRLLTGLQLGMSICNSPENAENTIILGRSFWSALIRGSYQGAVYYIDNLGVKID